MIQFGKLILEKGRGKGPGDKEGQGGPFVETGKKLLKSKVHKQHELHQC